MAPEVRFIDNRLGGVALVIDGCKYRINRRSGTTVYWRCFFRWCRANAVVEDGKLKSSCGKHICSQVCDISYNSYYRYFLHLYIFFLQFPAHHWNSRQTRTGTPSKNQADDGVCFRCSQFEQARCVDRSCNDGLQNCHADWTRFHCSTINQKKYQQGKSFVFQVFYQQ